MKQSKEVRQTDYLFIKSSSAILCTKLSFWSCL